MKEQFITFSIVTLTAAVIALNLSCNKDKAPTLSVSPANREIVFAANGVTATADGLSITPNFSVETNQGCSWDVIPGKTWVKVSKSANSFTLSADRVTGVTAPDEATVTVTAGDATPVIIRIRQLATDPWLSVTPPNRNVVFSFDGSTATSGGNPFNPTTFNVFTNVGTWSVDVTEQAQTWLTVNRDATNNTFTLIASDTGFETPTEAGVTVTAGTQSVEITVTKKAAVSPMDIGEITNLVLKNTEAPFVTTGEKVYENAAGTDMAWLAADWKVNAAAAISGNVRWGANDWDCKYDLGMTGWTGAFDNGKLFQTVELPAGTYRYVVIGQIGTIGATNEGYIAAALGYDLPNTADLPNDALGFTALPSSITTGTSYSLEFVLSQQNTVSMGFVATMWQAQAYFSKIELWKDQ